MEETKEDILFAASQRVCDKLRAWRPEHPALMEVRLTLLMELPNIIQELEDEA